MKSSSEIILFFDGVCALCNHSVDFVIKRDKVRKIKYASLQSQKAKEELSPELIQSLQTLILKLDDKIYIESDAVLKTFQLLGSPWKYFYCFKILPKFFRDFIYRLISKNRYRFFGKKDQCRLPSVEEKKQLL